MVEEKKFQSKNEVKLLGITIDDKLSFNKHITNLCNTVKPFASFNKDTQVFINRATKTPFRCLYYALF